MTFEGRHGLLLITSGSLDRTDGHIDFLNIRNRHKDDTLMPGEWYGGRLYLEPPATQGDGPKSNTITIHIGNDRHVITVSQDKV